MALITRISSLSLSVNKFNPGPRWSFGPSRKQRPTTPRVKMDLHLINLKFLLVNVKYAREINMAYISRTYAQLSSYKRCTQKGKRKENIINRQEYTDFAHCLSQNQI